MISNYSLPTSGFMASGNFSFHSLESVRFYLSFPGMDIVWGMRLAISIIHYSVHLQINVALNSSQEMLLYILRCNIFFIYQKQSNLLSKLPVRLNRNCLV